MPPREDGASPKSFTWITGNPRSKKNITQIRRHAGQNSGVKAENGTRAQSGTSPKPGQRGSSDPFRAVYPSPRTDITDEHSLNARGEQSISFHVNYPSAAAEYAPATSSVTHESSRVSHPDHPVTPSSEVPPALGENAAPTRKLAIWDLVNHSVEEEERHRLEVSATTPRQDTEDDRQDYFGGSTARTELKQIFSEARSHPPRHGHKPSSSPAAVVLQANIAKRRKATSSSTTNSHISWRLGMPQSPRSMSLSKEDSQMEQILLQTNAFYAGNFESSWSVHLREGGASYFDKISDMERFAGSVTTAGGLMALGRIDAASSLLNSALPALSSLLVSKHPQVYFLLGDLSLSASTDTALGRLRGQVKRFAASTALTTLGHMHPITRLLHLTFSDTSDAQRLHLRELIQRRVHELHEEYFGPNSYQTTGQYYYLARVLSQIGRFEESHKVLSEVVKTWESVYGANNIMPITGLLELTRLRLSLNDSSNDTESLLSDALRRTLTLEKSASQEDSPNPGLSPKMAGLVNARIGCIRTLGRLHVMRGNLETAMMQYTAAVSVGIEELGARVPAVQLAFADLDAVSQMIRARAEDDESVRLEWLGRTPVEVGLRWQEKERDERNGAKG